MAEETLYSVDFQRSVLKLVCTNIKFSSEYGMLLKREYFDALPTRILYKLITDYSFSYQKELDKDDLSTLVDEYCTEKGLDERSIKSLSQESNAILKVFIKSEQFIIDRVLKFVRRQELKNALIKSVDLLDSEGEYESVLKLVDSAVSIGYGQSDGLEFVDLLELPDTYRKTYSTDKLISTGFPEYDRCLMGGMAPGELHVIMAPPKCGKSTLACNIATGALSRGKPVYHITLEISALDVLVKYAARISGMPYSEIIEATVEEGSEYIKAVSKWKKYMPKLYVNHWTERTVNVLSLRSWISRIRSKTGDDPALIIVDYDDPVTGETLVPMLDGTERRIDSLVGEKEFWLYACKENGEVVPGRGHSARVARHVDELIEITFDNGESVRSTINHNHMLRDGSFKRADEFKVGDSMMPLYRRVDSLGYEMVRCNKSREYKRTHRVVAEKFHDIPDGIEVHHKDHNKLNNHPDNLDVMKKSDHISEHWSNSFYARKSEMTKEQWKDESFREKFVSGVKKKWEDENWRKQRSSQTTKQMNERFKDQSERDKVSENFKELWKNPEHKKSMSEKSKERWKDPEFREKMKKSRKVRTPEERKEIGKKISEARRKKGPPKKDQYTCDVCGINLYTSEIGIRNHKRSKSCVSKEEGPNNHKVVSVKRIKLEEPVPVYCLTVDGYHNYALSAGIFTHNCLLPVGNSAGGQVDMYEDAGRIYSDLIGLGAYFDCPVLTFAQPRRDAWEKPNNSDFIYAYELAHSAKKAHKAFSISSMNFADKSDTGTLLVDLVRRGISSTQIPIYRDLKKGLIQEIRR